MKHPERLVEVVASKLPTNLNRQWAEELLDAIKEEGYVILSEAQAVAWGVRL